MINVKDQVYAAIKHISKNTGDTYPRSWEALPAIQYVEEDNSVYSQAGGTEDMSHLLYRIDIWDNKSTSGTALEIDKAVSKLGLKRVLCKDVDDPSGLNHKVMRYEGILDVDTEFVFDNR